MPEVRTPGPGYRTRTRAARLSPRAQLLSVFFFFFYLWPLLDSRTRELATQPTQSDAPRAPRPSGSPPQTLIRPPRASNLARILKREAELRIRV
ncbi:hypothetical protein NL676_003535 [Syzygium grande]|nr:hypothetical protein NL676_003535 [Syzygium grande]